MFTKGKTKRVAASVDLTQGNLFKRIVVYTLPIILTSLLQLLFNAADLVVVGKSTSRTALGAVGSTNALTNLIINLLIGLSVGAGVLAARYFGSKDERAMHELVHTSIPTAAIGGVVFGLIGFFGASTFLGWMKTDPKLIEQATLYVKIYSIGIPFSIIYNFGAAILRSVGDTTRPLIFLVIAGVLNVLFNLLFVLAFRMDVDGVATATIISQAISAVLVIVYMMRVKEAHRFEFKKMHIYKDKLIGIIKIGLPAGIQGSFFSISNVIIQSSINSFGDIAVSGNTAAVSIEGFVFTSLDAFHLTALNFTGQHIGAKKYRRLKKILFQCLLSTVVLGLVLGFGAILLAKPLLRIYTSNPLEIAYGVTRLRYCCWGYFICGVMDVMSGMLRGMGYSTSSMLITLFSVCGLRIVWIFTLFKVAKFHALETLYISYPISWAVCVLFQTALFIFAYCRLLKRAKAEENTESSQSQEVNLS